MYISKLIISILDDQLSRILLFIILWIISHCVYGHSYQNKYYSIIVLVMGLTLDMGSKLVFWIVRSYEGSTLFKATSANQLKPGDPVMPMKMSILQSPDMQGN